MNVLGICFQFASFFLAFCFGYYENNCTFDFLCTRFEISLTHCNKSGYGETKILNSSRKTDEPKSNDKNRINAYGFCRSMFVLFFFDFSIRWT